MTYYRISTSTKEEKKRIMSEFIRLVNPSTKGLNHIYHSRFLDDDIYYITAEYRHGAEILNILYSMCGIDNVEIKRYPEWARYLIRVDDSLFKMVLDFYAEEL